MVVAGYFDRIGTHKSQHNYRFIEIHSCEVFSDVALDRAPRKTLIPTKCSSLSGSSVFMLFFFFFKCFSHFCRRMEWSRIVYRFCTNDCRTNVPIAEFKRYKMALGRYSRLSCPGCVLSSATIHRGV